MLDPGPEAEAGGWNCDEATNALLEVGWRPPTPCRRPGRHPAPPQQQRGLALLLEAVEDRVSVDGDHLELPHLLLSDLVVAVRYQILPHLRQGEGNSGVRLCRGSKCRDFHVEILLQVLVLGVLGGAQLLLLPCNAMYLLATPES